MESNIPLRLIGFHAQQGAEKYLKAFLVNRFIDFPYTHSINVLIELCPFNQQDKENLKPSTVLTDYAVARRYPIEYSDMTVSEARELVKLAGNVKTVVLRNLSEQGYNFDELL